MEKLPLDADGGTQEEQWRTGPVSHPHSPFSIASDVDANDEAISNSRKQSEVLTLFLFYALPALCFLVLAIVMWRLNRLGAAICLSAMLFSIVFGVFHKVVSGRREQNREKDHEISWECSFCLEPLIAEADEAGALIECDRCKAVQRVPHG